jgi:nucleoside-diphosphate-sugar epimerase
VLVTGANGFIGSHVVRRLVESGYETVAGIGPTADAWRLTDVLDAIETVALDLQDLQIDALARKLSGTTTIVHLAARGVNPSQDDAEGIVSANLGGTLRLLELARELGAQRFVHCGSCFEYGTGALLHEDSPLHPVAVYGASKAGGTLLAQAFGRAHGLSVVALRPFTAYGPFEGRHRLVPSTILSALRRAPIDLTGGEQTRDFVFVEDIAEAFLIAVEANDVAGETFNLCTGTETTVRELAQKVVDLTGTSAELRFGALPYRDDELWSLSGDPRRSAARLGWTARTSLHEGLQRTVAWFRDQQPIAEHAYGTSR